MEISLGDRSEVKMATNGQGNDSYVRGALNSTRTSVITRAFKGFASVRNILLI